MYQVDELPLTKNIQFVQGDFFSLPVLLGTPTSGFAFDGHITTPSGVVAMASASDPLSKTVTLSLPGTITQGIDPGVYPWQFSFTDALGLRTTWFQGNATSLANK